MKSRREFTGFSLPLDLDSYDHNLYIEEDWNNSLISKENNHTRRWELKQLPPSGNSFQQPLRCACGDLLEIATLAREHMCSFCHTKRHLHFIKTWKCIVQKRFSRVFPNLRPLEFYFKGLVPVHKPFQRGLKLHTRFWMAVLQCTQNTCMKHGCKIRLVCTRWIGDCAC